MLLAIGLAGTGVTAMAAFWAYFADPLLGKVCAYGILLGSITIAAWSWRALREQTRLLRRLGTPLALWALGSLFLVFLGFLHGGTDQPLPVAASRFSHTLPSDPEIPLFYSDWLFHHGHGAPPVFPGEWLSSDRPPLQIGYVLAQRPFAWDSTNLHYEVLGVVIQQLWIVAAWALLIAARVRPTTRALAVIAVLVTDIAIVNGFFVWPKMLAAAFLLAAAALLVTPGQSTLRREPATTVLLACLCGLAFLAHGASVFGIVPLLALAALRRLPGWRWVGAGLLAGAVLLVPWSAYQKYFDPPGNRVVKWQLAGVVPVDSRGTATAVLDAYRKAGVWGTVDRKVDNFVTMSGGEPAVSTMGDAVDRLTSGEVAQAIRDVRSVRFFYLLPSLGLYVLVPVLMMAARRRGRRNPTDWRFAVICFSLTALGWLFWGLLMFGPPDAPALIHVGSLALPVLAVCGAVAGLRATFPRLASILVGANVLAALVLYAPSLDPLPGSGYSGFAAVLATASLAGFGLVAFRADATSSPSATSSARSAQGEDPLALEARVITARAD
jgi:hypothetical protein